MQIAIALLIPFMGTTLGASMVFLMKNKINLKIEKLLLGFAAGVMISASIWSLMIPSINMAEEQNITKWVPATIGFLLGIIFLLALDNIIPHLHLKSDKPEGIKAKFRKSTMMVLAVTLHNIPEGMAVGVTLAGVIVGHIGMTFAGAIALTIGIAIQNFPEGTIVSLPIYANNNNKLKSFLYGFISGIVEPISAILMFFLVNYLNHLLPYFLSFAAGAMIYVVVEELIPESQNGKHSNLATISLMVGFILMMILDIALG